MSGRSPESVRVMESEIPAGFVLAETVREPASVLPSDQCEPSVASALTFSLNLTVTEFSDAATAPLMEGGVMSADVSTATDEKSASELFETSCTKPEVREYESRGESEVTMVLESVSVTVMPDTEMEETVGEEATPDSEKSPGVAELSETSSEIVRAITVPEVALVPVTVGAMPSTTVTVASSSWLFPSVIPPVVGFMYMSERSGPVSGRSPESVRVMEFELPAGFVLAETVREPASVLPSDQCEPSVASALTFSLNLTVTEFSDAATAPLMEGGVMSADVSTATDEKSASELFETSCTKPEVREYESRGESEVTMVLESVSVTVMPDTEMEETVGEEATPDSEKSPGVAELSETSSEIVRAITVPEVALVPVTVGAMPSTTVTVASSSWLFPSVIPPVVGFAYMSSRSSGPVSGRSPESVRVMESEIPAGFVLAETVREPASVLPSDQCEPSVASALTFSLNLTVTEFSDAATAPLMAGGVMSADVSTVTDEKSASGLVETSCTKPEVREYESRGESEVTMVLESVSVTVMPDTEMEETVGEEATPDSEKSPGVAELSETSSEIVRAITVPEVALVPVTVGAMPSTTVTVASSSWLFPSVIPPVVGFMYMSERSGPVSGRSPESVRVMEFELPAGFVLAETVREPASVLPSDQCEPSVASALTFSLNLTVTEFSDAATAPLMAGGVMSADVSTVTDEKSASGLVETSCTKPEVREYESRGESEVTMVLESVSVTVMPDTEMEETVGEEATPDSEKSPGVAELSETSSEIVRAITVPEVALVPVTVGAMPSTTVTVASSSWLFPSVIPPVVGFMYMSERSGPVSGRSPESVRVMESEIPAGFVLAETVREPASVLPSDQCEPSVASALTFSLNLTVTEFSDAATAPLMAGGVMSADVSTVTDEKSASELFETSCTKPEVREYESRGESEVTMVLESVSVTVMPDTEMEETVGEEATPDSEKSPGVAELSETSSEIVRAITVPEVALVPVTVGAMPSTTVTVASSSWLFPSVIPPVVGFMYMSERSGPVSGRSPESVRVMESEIPAGFVLAETVREPASVLPSDQCEPSVASALTFSLNLTVTEFSDAATAPLMEGGVMSADVSTVTDEKSASELFETSCTKPEVREYESRGESEVTMVLESVSVTVMPDTEMEETVGEEATPDSEKSPGVAELSETSSEIVRAITVPEVALVPVTVGAMPSTTVTVASSSWLFPSVIPPVVGFAYMSSRSSGPVSGRSPESVRVMESEIPAGFVLAETVREPASVLPSDQCEPSVASALTFSLNLTVTEFSDAATAPLMAGGVMSADVSTVTDEKSASELFETSCTKPEVREYESRGESEVTMVLESVSVTVMPDTEMEETVGEEATPDSEKSPGVAELSETSSEIVRAITVPEVALVPVTVGAMPSTTVTVASSSWLFPSVIPPVVGFMYMSERSGPVSGRSPESVRVMESEIPAGFVLAETVREPASVLPSDQCEPSVASALTFSLNLTVTEFSDAATAPLMEGGVMSADVSTATDEKSASELFETSCTKPEVREYESRGESEVTMVLESVSVTVMPDTEMEETVGEEATPDSEKSPGVAELSETSSEIVRAITVPEVALVPVTVGAMPSTTVTVASSSWLFPSVIPPVVGFMYMSERSGPVSGRSPESVRVMESEIPAGFVLAETVREPASVLPSDQCEPSVASALTFSLNLTVTEFSDAATAPLMEGGVMSADVSTATDEKSASELFETSCTKPEVREYESRGESEVTMVLESVSVTVMPDTEMEETVGEEATPDSEKSPGVAELSETSSEIVRAITVPEVALVPVTVGAMPSTTVTVASSSWLFPSVIPPVVGFMYMSSRSSALCQAGHLRASGSWNPRSPRDSCWQRLSGSLHLSCQATSASRLWHRH